MKLHNPFDGMDEVNIDANIANSELEEANDLITALESTIRNHEEDSAALPEDMSITETIKMKDKRIDTLKLALADAVSQDTVDAMHKYYHSDDPEHFPVPDFLSTNIVCSAQKKSEALNDRIATLALALQLIQDAYNDGTTASDTITFQVQDYVDLAETELKEATDE